MTIFQVLKALNQCLGALCYAELGTLITKSGAEYSYILESFGGLLAFLFSWISVFVLKPAMLAIICMTLSEYIVQPFFLGCSPDSWVIKLITIFFIGMYFTVNLTLNSMQHSIHQNWFDCCVS